MYGPIGHRFDARNYFWSCRNRKIYLLLIYVVGALVYYYFIALTEPIRYISV